MTGNSLLFPDYLADVGIEVNHTITEFLHILSYQLVWVGNTVVQVANLIVRETPIGRDGIVKQQCSRYD